jgi:hypothetical protein
MFTNAGSIDSSPSGDEHFAAGYQAEERTVPEGRTAV